MGTTDPKKCFVISPIGPAGSPERDHADDVFDAIIKPACDRVGYVASRADHEPTPGLITEQMYDAILSHDLIIAVLTYNNPNVFYEVAIAEAAARPLVLLIEDSTKLPFDVKDRRVLSYDLRYRSFQSKVHVDRLCAVIQASERQKPPRTVPFRPQLTPLGGAGFTHRIERRISDIPVTDRIRLFDEATSFVNIRGLALSYYEKEAGLSEAIDRALQRKVTIRVLILHPHRSPLEVQLAEVSVSYREAVQRDILQSIKFWESKARGTGLQLRLQDRGAMFMNIQQNEHQVIYATYCATGQTGEVPAIYTSSQSPLYDFARREFNMTFDTARRVSDDDDDDDGEQ